jgi:hypothetical protein
MYRGQVLWLLAGCAGDPGDSTSVTTSTEKISATTAPAAEPARCEVIDDQPVGWDDPALGSTPADLFASATGLFVGLLDADDGAVPISLDIDSDLGEMRLVTRDWLGEGEPSEDCADTVEAAFAARFWSYDEEIDSTFTSLLVADGRGVDFAAALPASDVSESSLSNAATLEDLALRADLDPPGVWSGWLTLGGENVWFQVERAY